MPFVIHVTVGPDKQHAYQADVWVQGMHYPTSTEGRTNVPLAAGLHQIQVTFRDKSLNQMIQVAEGQLLEINLP